MTKKFPNQIPIFPLSGVIYFPNTNLPLNIFEQRYLDLVNDTMRKDKLMGMIQSSKQNETVYKVGCLGKISDFRKSEDGRILINLTGLIRFEVLEEIEANLIIDLVLPSFAANFQYCSLFLRSLDSKAISPIK